MAFVSRGFFSAFVRTRKTPSRHFLKLWQSQLTVQLP